MSPNVGNFVHDLVEMAKAMEALPGLQAELDKAHGDIEAYAKQVQRLEMRLMERSSEIDSLNSKVREAEASRDQAETMFLECDDKLSAFRRLVKSFASDATTLSLAQEPAPAVAVQAEEQVQAMSEPDPQTFTGFEPAPAANPEPVYPWHNAPNPQGQSGANPTHDLPPVQLFDTLPDASSPPAPVEAVTSTGQGDAGVSVGSDPTHTPESPAVTNQDTGSDSHSSQSATPPTSAPVDPTGTTTEPEASSSDPEPVQRWTHEWYEWRDRQLKKSAF